MARVAVIGIGNVLTGDDAIGPYVVKVLEARYALPDGRDRDRRRHARPRPHRVHRRARGGGPRRRREGAGRRRASCASTTRRSCSRRRPCLAMSPHEPGVREALLTPSSTASRRRCVRLVGVIPCDRRAAARRSRRRCGPRCPHAVAAVVERARALGVARRAARASRSRPRPLVGEAAAPTRARRRGARATRSRTRQARRVTAQGLARRRSRVPASATGVDDRAPERRRRPPLEGRRIALTGTVQGVGFRPFVYRLAHETRRRRARAERRGAA